MDQIKLLLIIVLAGSILACEAPKVNPSTSDLLKDELMSVISEDQSAARFSFKSVEDEKGHTVVMKNTMIGDKVEFGKADASILLGYYAEKAKGSNSSKVYKSELVKRGKTVSVVLKDKSGKVIERNTFPIADISGRPTSSGGFDTLDDCIDSFFCTTGALQCEANRTCETQFYGTTCCLSDGLCYSIHFVFPPTSPFCRFRAPWLDIPLVLTRA